MIATLYGLKYIGNRPCDESRLLHVMAENDIYELNRIGVGTPWLTAYRDVAEKVMTEPCSGDTLLRPRNHNYIGQGAVEIVEYKLGETTVEQYEPRYRMRHGHGVTYYYLTLRRVTLPGEGDKHLAICVEDNQQGGGQTYSISHVHLTDKQLVMYDACSKANYNAICDNAIKYLNQR